MPVTACYFSDANIRLTALEEDVVAQQAQIQAIEQSDTEQDDRMLVLEKDVDTWDDRIVILESSDRDIQDRLATLEETILSNTNIFIFIIFFQIAVIIEINHRNNALCFKLYSYSAMGSVRQFSLRKWRFLR